MGRPTIFKRGALTPAERQARRRTRLRRDKREAEKVEKRERNRAKFVAWIASRPQPDPVAVAQRFGELEERDRLHRLHPPEADDLADNIVRGIAESMWESDLDIEQIRAAIDRRYGPRPPAPDPTDDDYELTRA